MNQEIKHVFWRRKKNQKKKEKKKTDHDRIIVCQCVKSEFISLAENNI